MPPNPNTRNRTGCLTCRHRHVRCDEQRPYCRRCLTGGRLCKYLPVTVPLRDRRMLQKNEFPPGQLAPWALVDTPSITSVELRTSTAMDPFDILPVKMPFKSQELYHYFYQSGAAFSASPSNPKEDCLALANLDEHALRSTIIIAGIHYSWNTGNLQSYDSAFLFHKVESIRVINEWLEAADSQTFVVCVRQILTICLAEACLGNIAAAEIHLNGLMALFDTRGKKCDPWSNVDDVAIELTNRYLILASCFVVCLKSRLAGFLVLCKAEGIDPNNDGTPAAALRLMKIWHGMENGGLPARLKALRMFPYFFSLPPADRRPKTVDPLPVIECLRAFTVTVDRYYIDPTPHNLNEIWNKGGPTKLLALLVEAHVSSFASDDGDGRSPAKRKISQPASPKSSWSGISAAMELYMLSVLSMTDGGEPLECRLLYRILLIMKQDITQYHYYLSGEQGRLGQSIWFWKVFVGALALAKSQYHHRVLGMKCVDCPGKKKMEKLYEWFCDRARAWSIATGMTKWLDVEAVLVSVTWPVALPRGENDHAASTWDTIITRYTQTRYRP